MLNLEGCESIVDIGGLSVYTALRQLNFGTANFEAMSLAACAMLPRSPPE